MDNGTTKPSDELKKWAETMTKGERAERFILEWIGGERGYDDIRTRFEIKNSWDGGPRICIEEDSVVELNKKGWIYTITADNVLFFDETHEGNVQAVVVTTYELRRGYKAFKDQLELYDEPLENHLHTQHSDRDGKKWTSTCVFVPLVYFSHAIIKFKRWEVKP